MRLAMLWALVGASLLLCSWAGRRYMSARSEAVLALRQLAAVTTDSREIASIRAAAPPETRRHRPPPGLAARVADVVSKAGLPQAAVQIVSPETEINAGASGLHKQSAKITLDGLVLPELGRFLQEWRAAQPVWTVTSIDITPTLTRARALPGQTVDRPLKAVLGIETLFADKEGSR
jgi:hypothetical protein